MSATVFYLFLGFTAFSTLLQLLLSLRQSRAVLLHRGRVPRDFKDVDRKSTRLNSSHW